MVALSALLLTSLSAPAYAEAPSDPALPEVTVEEAPGSADDAEPEGAEGETPDDSADGDTDSGSDATADDDGENGGENGDGSAPADPEPTPPTSEAPSTDPSDDTVDAPQPADDESPEPEPEPELDLLGGALSEVARSQTAGAATAGASSYSKGLIKQRVKIADARLTGPTPQQQLTRVDVTRDLVGRTLTAKATFKSNPTVALNSNVFVYLGTWSGNTCKARVGMVAGAASGGAGDAAGLFLSAEGTSEGSLGVTRSLSGNALTLKSKAHTKIRSSEWDCAYAFNTPSGDTSSTYTSFYAEDLEDIYKPKLSIDPGDPVQGNYKGKTTKIRVKIENSGRGDAANVRVKASGSGLSITNKSKSYSSIKSGRSQVIEYRVKIKSGSQRTLKITATASGGYKTSKNVKVVVKPKAKKYSSLSGRYFWGFVPTSLTDYRGWETRAIYFLNSKWAYLDFPKNGKKPKCTKSTSTCKRYSYDKRTGVAKIGSQKFKVNTEGFRYKMKGDGAKAYFSPLTLPKKNARISASLVNRDWFGYCMITCTATTTWLTLGKNGRFVRAGSYAGSWPGIGSTWGGVSADQRGTYRVISTGRIELRYANGKKVRHTIGIMHDIRGKASANNEGVMLGDTNFYRD